MWFGFPAQLKVPESVLRAWTSRRTVSLWLGSLKTAEKIHRRYIKDGRSQRGSDLGAIPPRSFSPSDFKSVTKVLVVEFWRHRHSPLALVKFQGTDIKRFTS